MKLLTIGDSISQGFMSGAAARTDLCYSTRLARCLGLRPGADYFFPDWKEGGHPVNVELLFRRLQKLYGSDIFGPIEWPMAVFTIMKFLDRVEDFYERGDGALGEHPPTWGSANAVDFYHNLAIRGSAVADAWMLTPAIAREKIQADPEDNTFGFTQSSFDRTALAVLNPSGRPEYDQRSPLDWLEHHATTEGVENLVLWLGANNALGTILDMDIQSTADSLVPLAQLGQRERRPFNLWTPTDFADDYGLLLEKVVAIMQRNTFADWKVFVGNVPAVTVAPLAKGVGDIFKKPDPFGIIGEARYFSYYTYVPFDLKAAQDVDSLSLELEEAYFIDQTIAQFNRTIASELAEANQRTRAGEGDPDRFHLVDINRVLISMAYKRNGGNPFYELPDPLKALIPKPDTRFHDTTRKGVRAGGGIISLDGVHPSAIGQGVIAHEFKKVMEDAGVGFACELDWPTIIADDDLWNRPIKLIREIYQNTRLATALIACFGEMGRK